MEDQAALGRFLIFCACLRRRLKKAFDEVVPHEASVTWWFFLRVQRERKKSLCSACSSFRDLKQASPSDDTLVPISSKVPFERRGSSGAERNPKQPHRVLEMDGEI